MALHLVLRINNTPIGWFHATRREHLDLSDPAAISEEVCTYDAEIDDLQGGVRTAVVRHRYGDGAWTLLRKALAATGY